MLDAKQAERRFGVTCPALKDDTLLFRSMSASEQLGRPFEFKLELLSEDPHIGLNDVLGQSMTVRLDLPAQGKTRYFNGLVSRFSYLGVAGSYARYRAEVRPWLWFLTRRADCRIFQDMTVPDIIEQVFRDSGFTDFSLRLYGAYREREYCVQYRETDFDFVSRLMEQEGIYYFFQHDDGKHDLVLADSVSAHERIPGYESVPYRPPGRVGYEKEEYIADWRVYQQAQSGKYALRDFQFAFPGEDLKVEKQDPCAHDHADGEVYDYPGVYVAEGTSGPAEGVSDIREHGETYAQVRLEELHSQYERAQGRGEISGICSGGLFELIDYKWRDDQNREYLVISTALEFSSDAYEAGASEAAGSKCQCDFTVIDSKRPFRAPRVTPKPVVQGPQTAIVTGPAGEEIWTDKHGRVKVKFHWDRVNEKDEKSSCWIRVSQPWAGKSWGAVAIPRIGQEVVVDFLEGDPDRPLVTGRVYNADFPPPYGLPDSATQSGIKSRSSKGGSADNFNEIRFEDKKGEEEVYVHAEKDMNRVVENNDTQTVGFDKQDPGDQGIAIHNDRSLAVGRDKFETVGRNKETEVSGSHEEKIGGSQTIFIGSNLSENVAINYSETVGAAMELTVGGAMAMTVGGVLAETVGATKEESIGSSKTERIGSNKKLSTGKDFNQDIGKNKDVKVGGDYSEIVEGKHKETVEKEYILQAKKIQVLAEDEISIKTGKAEIVMKKNGDINVKGKKISIKGSGDVVVKGSKIKEN